MIEKQNIETTFAKAGYINYYQAQQHSIWKSVNSSVQLSVTVEFPRNGTALLVKIVDH